MTATSLQFAGNVVDIFAGTIEPGTIHVRDSRIERIEKGPVAASTYLLPGFIDAHVHIESSMLVPSEFARLAVPHGTVATVSDPHEIGNVMGIPGVRYMIENGHLAPLKFHFGAPSCVPACSFDHSGATLGPDEVAHLLDDPEILYLSEMMNFPGVLMGLPDVMGKIAAAHARHKPVDGHAPGVRGADIRTYAGAGITTDHESTSYDEALEKIQVGIKCLIREGSAAKNFEALIALLDLYPDKCMFCSDDKHPDDLVEGHINELVRRAVAKGIDVFKVLRCASRNPVEHYGLRVGLLRPGDPADFIEVDNLHDFTVLRTFIEGICVADRGVSLLPHLEPPPINFFETPLKRPEEFVVAAPAGAEQSGAMLQVIEAINGQIITRRIRLRPKIIGGRVIADLENDVLKMALVDRYGGGTPAVAFIKNFGLRSGAIASSVAHDSHNIVVVGVDDEALARAVNLVIEARGGISAVGEGVSEVLPLPIAGLMSGNDGYEIGAQYAQLDKVAKQLGSKLSAPFMTLSFMALLVIPELKLGPPGLFDVGQFKPVGLFD